MKKLSTVIILTMIAVFCGNGQKSFAESGTETAATTLAPEGKAPPPDFKAAPEPAFERGPHGENSEKMKKRLEQLFVWRVSDRLKLTPQEETKFTEQFKKLSDERTKLFQEMDSILDKIESEKDNADKASKLLTDYNSVLKKQSQIQTKEMDSMSKLFGTKKMVQYVLLKREMTQRFKRVLSQNGSDGTAKGVSQPEKASAKEPDGTEPK